MQILTVVKTTEWLTLHLVLFLMDVEVGYDQNDHPMEAEISQKLLKFQWSCVCDVGYPILPFLICSTLTALGEDYVKGDRIW